jgi:hypothetical protein
LSVSSTQLISWLLYLKPYEFPIETSEDLRRVYPGNVFKKFDTAFRDDALNKQMKECIDEPTYLEISNIRDVLSHRGVLPRNFYEGGQRYGMATIPANPKDLLPEWRYDLPIDKETTTSRRRWLSEELTKLVEATYDFCNRNLKHTIAVL